MAGLAQYDVPSNPVTEKINSSGLSESQLDTAFSMKNFKDTVNSAYEGITEIYNTVSEAIPSTKSPVNSNGANIPKKDAKTGKEKNPPAPNKGQTGTVPQKGQADVATTARSVTTKNGISYTNDNLTYVCDFTIQLDLEICKKKFEVIGINETLRLASLGTWAASVHFPFIDQIRSLYNTLKGWYDMIKDWMNEIKEWIDCLKSIISAIQTVVSFAVNLPATVLSQVFNCIAGFGNLLTDALTSSLDAIKVDISSQNAASDVESQMSNAKSDQAAAEQRKSNADKK